MVKKQNTAVLLDMDLILGVFSADKPNAIAMFKKFNEIENNDRCLDCEVTVRMTGEEARQELIKHIDKTDITWVKSLPKADRDEILRKVKGIKGISQRQAARILGISANLIFKA